MRIRFSVLGACTIAAGTSTALAAAATGQFTTANGKIYDPNGNPYVARGVNVDGQNYWTNHDPTPDVNKVVDDWGFNMVRAINLPVADWRGPGYGIKLDEIVNAYTARKAVVVIEAHESTGSYWQGDQLNQITNWFAGLAAKYKDNPYVWFNTANEPGNMQKPASGSAAAATWDQWTPDGAKWLNMNQTIISAIRKAGNNNVVLVDGTNYGQDQAWDDLGNLVPKHSAILTYGPTLASEFSNVVFDTHVYGEWSSPGAISQRLPKYIQAAQAANLPLIFGEYGATIDGDYVQVQQQFLAIANQYNIGRAAWAWSDSGTWDLTTAQDPTAIGTTWEWGGGYLIDSPTNPTNLTPFGQMVWADNHAATLVPEPSLGLVAAGAAVVIGVTRRRRTTE
jgi:mannan endo-1,4-beta-mannosidase